MSSSRRSQISFPTSSPSTENAKLMLTNKNLTNNSALVVNLKKSKHTIAALIFFCLALTVLDLMLEKSFKIKVSFWQGFYRFLVAFPLFYEEKISTEHS